VEDTRAPNADVAHCLGHLPNQSEFLCHKSSGWFP
jgi:hypothetical protein